MRLLASLLAAATLAALLAPASGLASAAEIPPSGERTVGPCTYRYSWFWPGSHSTLTCVVEGQEVLYYTEYETWGGHGCELRVLGDKVYGCNES